MIVIAECVVAVIVMRLRELLIENFLLIRGQYAANLAKPLPEEDMALVVEIPPRLHHFEAGVAQDVADLIALRRGQTEVAIQSIYQPAARHSNIAVAICERAKRETNQKA